MSRPQSLTIPANHFRRTSVNCVRHQAEKRAMKKPSRPPWSGSMPGSVRSQPSAVGCRPAGSSSARIGSGVSDRRRRRLASPRRLQRAGGVNQRAAGREPARGARQQRCLQLGHFLYVALADAVEHVGVAAAGAGRGARRIQQDGVELVPRLPLQRIGQHG